MINDSEQQASAGKQKRSVSAKWIGLGLVGLWIILVVLVYIVVVQLKLGGTKAIQSTPDADTGSSNSSITP